MAQPPIGAPTAVSDSNVEAVRQRLYDRMLTGWRKYETTTERTDLSRLDWLQHLQDELLDGAVYVERLKKEFECETK